MSKKDDEINRQLIFNSGGANPEDYLTPKQLQRYLDNPDKFIDIDIDLVMNEKEEKKVEQNLMFDVTGYPEEKFTENGERYYYTRPDGTPITGSNWSLKDLAYPLNLLFGGKSPTDESWGLEEGSQEQLNAELSKHSFGSWLVNTAPSQLLPFLGGAKKFKQVQHNKKVMKNLKYQEKVEDVTGFGDVKIHETIIDGVQNLNPTDARNLSKLNNIKNKGLIKDFTSGSLRKNSLFSPNRDDTTKLMFKEGTPNDKPEKSKLPPKVTTNEKMKQALLNDEAIILNPTYRGGKITVRDEADFFDVSAALIGPGQEIKKDSKGRKIPYDRKGVTEFGSTKSTQRDKIYKHLQAELGLSLIHI